MSGITEFIRDPTIIIDDQIVTGVAKLNLEHGDILLVHCPSNTKDQHAKLVVASFREWLRQNAFADVRVLCVLGETQLDVLDESRMQSYGWVREKGYARCK